MTYECKTQHQTLYLLCPKPTANWTRFRTILQPRRIKMTFFTIIVRGLLRRPVRTGLTLVGISIGIAAVVALVGLASGYEKSIGKQLDVIGIDVVVSNMGGGFMPKAFDASLQSRIAGLRRVAETTSVLMEMQ